MIFLLKFREDILSGEALRESKSKFFINFAQEVRKPFKDPGKIIDIIFNHKNNLLQILSTQE
jgi:hypothetical protein